MFAIIQQEMAPSRSSKFLVVSTSQSIGSDLCAMQVKAWAVLWPSSRLKTSTARVK